MGLTIDQIAEAFCSHHFAETYPYMADEIKWTMIGRQELIGREAVIAHCIQGLKFLETVSTTYPKLKIYRADPFVIVEGAARFQDKDNQILTVASCDVFSFQMDS
jgi:hypothetical protein